MAKKALVVGINDYPQPANHLPSCVEDAKNFKKLLEDAPFGFTVRDLVNSAATVSAVENGLKWLFADAKTNDQLVFFYSGHGYTSAQNRIFQEYLCLHDDMLQDDRFSALTQNLPDGIFTCVFDSCFSGGMEKPRMLEIDGEPVDVKRWKTSLEIEMRDREAETNATRFKGFGCKLITTPNAQKTKDFQIRIESDEAREVQFKGLLISACQEYETAAASSSKTHGMSAFTYCFLDALSNAATDKSLDEVVKDATSRLLDLGFRQTPCVKYPPSPVGLNARPFLSMSAASGADSPTDRSKPVDSGHISEIAAIIAAVLSSQRKSINYSIHQEENKMTSFEKGSWEAAVPLAIEIVRAMTKDKGFDISGGGGLSTPFGGAQGGGSFGSKGWEAAVPLAIEIVRAMSKDKGFDISGGGGVSTPFGGVQAGGSVGWKGWEDAVPLAIEIVRAMTKDKVWEISGGGGVSSPFGGGQADGSVGWKGWEAAVPLAIEIVRAMTKSQRIDLVEQPKVFGIDDAILWPAVASVIVAAINKK